MSRFRRLLGVTDLVCLDKDVQRQSCLGDVAWRWCCCYGARKVLIFSRFAPQTGTSAESSSSEVLLSRAARPAKSLNTSVFLQV